MVKAFLVGNVWAKVWQHGQYPPGQAVLKSGHLLHKSALVQSQRNSTEPVLCYDYFCHGLQCLKKQTVQDSFYVLKGLFETSGGTM